MQPAPIEASQINAGSGGVLQREDFLMGKGIV
jgi:hypothetical protein